MTLSLSRTLCLGIFALALLGGCADEQIRLGLQRAALTADVVRRSRRVAAVLVEPIQGEGGVRLATARFFRRLRVLTRIYDVPLVLDEVQTGFGATGRLWAHEHHDLPAPPDVVIWATKAQKYRRRFRDEAAALFRDVDVLLAPLSFF